MAGMDDGLVRVGVEQRADRGEQGRAVAARQVDPADRALEEDVAGENRVLAADRVGDVAGAVSGREDDVELEPRQLERLAAANHLVGFVALERPEPLPGDEGHDVGEDRDLDLRAVDRGPGGSRHRRHRADVVEVAMGDEDRLDRRPRRLDRRQDPLRLLTGIDDQQPIRVPAPEQEAVLGDGADRKHLGVERHYSPRARIRARSRRRHIAMSMK